MSKVNCGKCTACCQWGGNDQARIRLSNDETQEFYHTKYENPFTGQVEFIVDTDKDTGDCIYLDRESGCTIHDRAPKACQAFDCRHMLGDMLSKNDVYVNVLVAAISLRSKKNGRN